MPGRDAYRLRVIISGLLVLCLDSWVVGLCWLAIVWFTWLWSREVDEDERAPAEDAPGWQPRP